MNLELDFSRDHKIEDIAGLVLNFLQLNPAERLSTAVTLHVLGSEGGRFRYQGWFGDGHLKSDELALRIARYIGQHVNGRGGITYRGATVSAA